VFYCFVSRLFFNNFNSLTLKQKRVRIGKIHIVIFNL